jgi:hypothetical protein
MAGMKRLFALLAAISLAHCCAAIELETFSSKGNPKTYGVDFSIGRPKAWVTRNAMSPSAFAAFWKAPNGLVDSMTLVLPRTSTAEKRDVTKEDFRETFANPQLEKMLGRSLANASIVRKVFLEDFKYPAGFIEYQAKYKLPSGEAEVRVRNYMVYLGSLMMQIQFYLVQDGGEDRLKEFDDEMNQILASLEFTRP